MLAVYQFFALVSEEEALLCSGTIWTPLRVLRMLEASLSEHFLDLLRRLQLQGSGGWSAFLMFMCISGKTDRLCWDRHGSQY
jgi:hypothetical protein